MRQVQFEYTGDSALQADLASIHVDTAAAVLFHIFSTAIDRDLLLHIRDQIAEKFPAAEIVGATSNGNILYGLLQDHAVMITCTAFDDPDTRIEVLHFPLGRENENETANALVQAVNARSWVNGMELLLMIRGMSMTSFCRKMKDVRSSVVMFGGGCFANDIFNNEAFALSKGSGCKDHLVVVLYGGSNLHIATQQVAGWKPLGRQLVVTRADNDGRVYEFDGKPAYDTYYQYLHIRNDAHFFQNTLEFPFIYDNHGVPLLRAPISCYPDGSLQMTSDLETGSTVRMAFGDPKTILQNVSATGQETAEFCPQVIMIFSCAARKTFWGASDSSHETAPFNTLAPTSGFYTSGEFIRQKGELQQHNVSLVIAAFREGAASSAQIRTFYIPGLRDDGQVSVVARLASFIDASTSELEEANRKLARQSITDGLTQLLNRMEIQSRITSAVQQMSAAKEAGQPFRRKSDACSLIMIDLDFFKKVNDEWGHDEGDQVLIALSSLLRQTISEKCPGASIGRWGGEEFMILLPGMDEKDAAELAEILRFQFAALHFPHAGGQTMSLGVTRIIPGEGADQAASRVDQALYLAKKNGRNQVRIL